MQFYDIDLTKLNRYSIKTRNNKVKVEQFAPRPGESAGLYARYSDGKRFKGSCKTCSRG